MDFFTTVTLQAPYDYLLIWKIAAGVLLVAALAFLILPQLHLHRKPKLRLADGPTLEEYRRRALQSLASLEQDVREGRTDNRRAYQALSGIVRGFVRGATGIRVTNYTYEEIRALDMPRLTALVHDYYEPEFARDSEGEFVRSLGITTDLIRGWR